MDIVAPALSLCRPKESFFNLGDDLRANVAAYDALPAGTQAAMDKASTVLNAVMTVVGLVALGLAVYLSVRCHRGHLGKQIGMTVFAILVPVVYLIYHIMYHDVYKHPCAL